MVNQCRLGFYRNKEIRTILSIIAIRSIFYEVLNVRKYKQDFQLYVALISLCKMGQLRDYFDEN